MSEPVSIWERMGFRKASGVGEAGWGHTLLVAFVSFIYFLPVLLIIITSFKLQTEASPFLRNSFRQPFSA